MGNLVSSALAAKQASMVPQQQAPTPKQPPQRRQPTPKGAAPMQRPAPSPKGQRAAPTPKGGSQALRNNFAPFKAIADAQQRPVWNFGGSTPAARRRPTPKSPGNAIMSQAMRDGASKEEATIATQRMT